MLKVGLRLPQPGLEFTDLSAEVAGHGPGGVFLEAERLSRGLLFIRPPPAGRARWEPRPGGFRMRSHHQAAAESLKDLRTALWDEEAALTGRRMPGHAPACGRSLRR